MDKRSPKTYDRPMESGDAGAGGRSADDLQPSAATEIDVEEFLRSAYGAGLISLDVGELLLEYLDELKALSEATATPTATPANVELARARTAIAAATTRVQAALLRGEILPLTANRLTDALEEAGKSGEIAEIRAALTETELALKEAQSAQKTARQRSANHGRGQPHQQPSPSVQGRPTTAPPATTRPVETTPAPAAHTPATEGPPAHTREAPPP